MPPSAVHRTREPELPHSVFDPFPAASRTASFLLPAEPSAVREGRHRVGTTLLSWGLGLDEDSSWSLTVVCGELLAGAVRRAAGDAPGPAGRLAVGVDVDGDQLIVDVREVPGGAAPPARVRRAFP
ncbi:ATP-binding protein, partial [Streptomyces sp. SID5914]|nr:ATP-binding protein [Streptomyces sp. SID5914]